VGERGHRTEQRHGARVAEAQARGPLAAVDAREHERLEGGRVGEAGPSLTKGGQEAGIGGGPVRRSAVQFSALRVLWSAKSTEICTGSAGRKPPAVWSFGPVRGSLTFKVRSTNVRRYLVNRGGRKVWPESRGFDWCKARRGP
jgi:hypothetical protein